jgi:hypothetical protein
VEASWKEQKTEIWLFYTKRHVKKVKVAIKLGLFQGDSLSPLLFCLALIPRTNMFNKREGGYKVKGSNKVNHLFHMGDLKLFSIDETVTERDGHCQNI